MVNHDMLNGGKQMQITDYISLPEYAALHGKSRYTVAQKCQRGSLPGAVKVGRNWLIPADAPYPDNRVKSGQYTGCRKKGPDQD